MPAYHSIGLLHAYCPGEGQNKRNIASCNHHTLITSRQQPAAVAPVPMQHPFLDRQSYDVCTTVQVAGLSDLNLELIAFLGESKTVTVDISWLGTVPE